MLNFFKKSLLFWVFLNLFACTYSPDSLKEIYNELPNDVSEELKNPINPSAKQSEMIDSYAQELMQWHRRNKLPEYSQLVTQLATQLRQEHIPVHSIKKVLDKMDGIPHFDQARHLTPKIIALEKSLSPNQITRLELYLNNEYQKEMLELKNANTSTEIVDLFKMVFQIIDVDLKENQQRIIKTESYKFHDIRQYELQAEKAWNTKLVALLRQKDNPNFAAQATHHWNNQEAQLTGRGYQLEQQNNSLMANLLKKLVENSEPEQRDNLNNKLLSIANVFSELANE